MTSSPITILFLGTSPFAVPALDALAGDSRFSVLGVVTQPDKPVGRKQALTPPPVKVRAESLGLRVTQPENLRNEFPLLSLPRPDFLVTVSYGQILSREVLDFANVAPINVHASLLPRWRGAAPIQNAILAGDSETGVTIQRMVEELDAGPIYAHQSTEIGKRETTTSLHDRLKEIGASLLVRTLVDLPDLRPQEGPIVLCKKLSKRDGDVDVSLLTAEEIDRRVRALNPWPGVTINTEGSPLKLLETSLTADTETHPLTCNGEMLLHLRRVLPAGGRPMSGAAWARGRFPSHA